MVKHDISALDHSPTTRRFGYVLRGNATVLTSVGLLGLIVARISFLASPVASGASYYWQVSSGDWFVASNWGGIALGSNDYAYVIDGGTATITLSGAECYELSLGNNAVNNIQAGEIQMTGGCLSTVEQVVGFPATGSFLQSGGTNNVADAFQMDGNGAYSLSGSGLLSAGAVYDGGTFGQSSGTAIANSLNVVGGGTYSLSGNAQLSANNVVVGGWQSPGTFIQSGGTSTIASSLYVGGPDGGFNASSGTYLLKGGALLSASNIYVGDFNPGTFTQSGGSLFSAGNTYVGYDNNGDFTQSGGTNTIGGSLYVGGFGGRGSCNLEGSSLLSASNLFVAYGSGTGTLTQSGGTVAIANAMTLGSYGDSATYNLNGGVLILSQLTHYPGAAVFSFNGGTLRAGNGFSTSVPMTFGTTGGGATFDTAGYSVILSGSLSGAGLTKADSGTLTLAAANTFSGNTVVGDGTLTLADPLALQQSTLDTSGAGSLSFGTLTNATLGGLQGPGNLALSNGAAAAVSLDVGNNNASTTFSGAIGGPGSLTKVGSGTLSLAGSYTYTGRTTINKGTLALNGSLAGPVTIQSGGILSGTGSLSSVTVNAAGQLAPGNSSVGILSLNGDLSVAFGAVLDFELDTPSTSSQILMPTGELILSGQPFSAFDFTPSANFEPGIYPLIDAESISGNLGTHTSGTIDGYPATLTVSNNNLVLTVTPEPSTVVLLAAGTLGLLGCRLLRRDR